MSDRPADRQALVDSLVSDLTPVRQRASLVMPATVWWLVSWVWVVAVTLATGPLRPGAVTALATNPHFSLESLLGLVAGAGIAWVAFSESVPGRARRPMTTLALALVLLGAWVAAYGLGFLVPAVEPSMLGKRPHCFLETLLYSVPPVIAGWVLLRKRYVLRGVRAGAFLGLAAGLLPALMMQIACMYSPGHTLAFHIGPALGVGLVGAVLGAWLMRRP